MSDAPEVGGTGSLAGASGSAGAAPGSGNSGTSGVGSGNSGPSAAPSGASAPSPEGHAFSVSPGQSGAAASPAQSDGTSESPGEADPFATWDGFGSDPEPAEPPSSLVEPPPAASAQATQAAPVSPPASVEPPQSGTQAPSGTPTAPGPTAASAASLPSAAEPERFADMIRENEPALIEALAAEHFRLSPQEVEALNEDASQAVPRLMAKAYLRTTQHMLNHVARMVPAMLQRELAVQKARNESIDQFFGKFPQLKEHEADVMKTATLFRQMNPGATRNQAIQAVGVIVAAMKGITLPPTGGNGAAPSQHPPKAPAFVPAQSGPGAAPRVVEQGPWDGLSGNYDE